MKTTITLLLCLSLLGIFPLSALSQGQIREFVNKDVLAMSMGNFNDDEIIAKIHSSVCRFDTGAGTLRDLKKNDVSDSVIQAMVKAPYGTLIRLRPRYGPSRSLNTTGEVYLVSQKVSDGTEIDVQLRNNLSAQDVKLGDVIDFTVLRDVKINGATVFNAGASARGRVTRAKTTGYWGKAGKLEFAMQDVEAVDGTRVPARFTKRLVGDSKGGTVATAAVLTSLVFLPAVPFWGLKKGKAAIIPAGSRYSVSVQGDMTVDGEVRN